MSVHSLSEYPTVTSLPDADDGCASLFAEGDPPPWRAVNPKGSAPLLLLCDHATNAIPRRLASLGLSPGELHRHIAWDIGAEPLTCQLAALLDAQAILTSFSRLVVDCNRALADPTVMPEESDGTRVPGNIGLDADARRMRAEAIYWPYHGAIAAALDRFAARAVVPAVLPVHSFAPRLNGVDRPWHIGVLWDRDPRLAVPLIRSLSQNAGLRVGDNEPYSAREPTDFTLPYHAAPRGLPHALIEVRQDEITTAAGVARYAKLIKRALGPVLRCPEVFRTVTPR